MENLFSKSFVKRAVRTFLQALLGYLTVNMVLIDFNVDGEALRSTLVGLAVSSVAAGISAVMNVKEDINNENGPVG